MNVRFAAKRIIRFFIADHDGMFDRESRLEYVDLKIDFVL